MNYTKLVQLLLRPLNIGTENKYPTSVWTDLDNILKVIKFDGTYS
jgi:hypothetical protein